MPVLAVGGGSGVFTAAAVRQVATDVTAVVLEGIGHCAAMEAPDRLAVPLVSFIETRDPASGATLTEIPPAGLDINTTSLGDTVACRTRLGSALLREHSDPATGSIRHVRNHHRAPELPRRRPSGTRVLPVRLRRRANGRHLPDAHNVRDPAEAEQIMGGEVLAPTGFHVMAYDAPSSRPFSRGEEATNSG